jgi:hypothetical protein
LTAHGVGFLRISDLRFVRAERVTMGDSARAPVLAAVGRDIQAHTVRAANKPSAVIAA